jgi:outer membrane protein OmpA-like peptidoglycan-associated protein
VRVCLLPLLLNGCGIAVSDRNGGLKPRPAADYVAAAFNKYPLVAVSELHGNPESAAFLAKLIRHEGFARRVDDIVIEFGNAAYQDVVDRYISGLQVKRDELRGVWENTTQTSGIWLLPMYEEMLADIRAANALLPRDHRYRVLIGDPPIDWRQVRSPADDDMNDWRDAHFAWVVENYVLRRNRRALLFVGGGHISRKVLFPNSLIHLLDARFPGTTFVVSALDRGAIEPAVAAVTMGWPIPSAVSVRGTWLGRSDVRSIGYRFSRGSVEEDVDALLYLSASALVFEPPPPQIDGSNDELRRRRRLAQDTVPFRGALIRFEANAEALTPASFGPLQQVLSELLRDRDRTVVVKAFADVHEPNPLTLSTVRAEYVVAWLAARAVSRRRLEPLGCGTTHPLWADDAPEHQAANRRVEIVTKTQTAACEPPRSFEHIGRPAR